LQTVPAKKPGAGVEHAVAFGQHALAPVEVPAQHEPVSGSNRRWEYSRIMRTKNTGPGVRRIRIDASVHPENASGFDGHVLASIVKPLATCGLERRPDIGKAQNLIVITRDAPQITDGAELSYAALKLLQPSARIGQITAENNDVRDC
jgi:hypothetical protein